MCARDHLLQGVEMGPQIDPPGPWKAKTDAFQKGAEQHGQVSVLFNHGGEEEPKGNIEIIF